MKVWHSIFQAQQEIDKNRTHTVVTIGNFDGVHRGHQLIMNRTVELAKFNQNLALALTFTNHTESLVGEKPQRLNSPAIRREKLTQLSLDALVEVEFDSRLADLTPEVFFQKWLHEGLRAETIVIGYDFKFGAQGRGDYELLQELGAAAKVKIERVKPGKESGFIISSSKIRQLLAEGDIELANQMLGYPFMIEGEIKSGEQRGRTLGFPTANIYLDPEYQLPRYGVYLVVMQIEGSRYFGVASVGIKPTFGQYSPLIEVYLLDVEMNLYHKSARVEFIKFIRAESRFSGPEALKEQIKKDVEVARGLLKKYSRSQI